MNRVIVWIALFFIIAQSTNAGNDASRDLDPSKTLTDRVRNSPVLVEGERVPPTKTPEIRPESRVERPNLEEDDDERPDEDVSISPSVSVAPSISLSVSPSITVPPSVSIPPSVSVPPLISASPSVSVSRPSITIEPQDVVLPSEPTSVTFPVDFSSNEASIRTTIFQGDVQATADTMITSGAVSISAGLTYEERLSPLVRPSFNRNSDPNVVAFKALAVAAVTTRDASKFASAVVLSFRPDCTCGIYTPQQIDDLVTAFTIDFSNTTELQQIIVANANLSLGRRRLQLAGKSPVNSFVCSSCWPKKQCKKLHWC